MPNPKASPLPAYGFGSLVALIGAVVLIAGVNDARTAVAGAVVLLFGLAVLSAGRQRARRPLALSEAQRSGQQWLITDDGLEIKSDHTSARATWAAFGRAAVRPETYVLSMRDRNDLRTFDIPREPLTAEDDAELRAVFQRHDIHPVR